MSRGAIVGSRTASRIGLTVLLGGCLAGAEGGVGKPLQLDPGRSSLFLPQAKTRLGPDGIGKGYRVDLAAAVLPFSCGAGLQSLPTNTGATG